MQEVTRNISPRPTQIHQMSLPDNPAAGRTIRPPGTFFRFEEFPLDIQNMVWSQATLEDLDKLQPRAHEIVAIDDGCGGFYYKTESPTPTAILHVCTRARSVALTACRLSDYHRVEIRQKNEGADESYFCAYIHWAHDTLVFDFEHTRRDVSPAVEMFVNSIYVDKVKKISIDYVALGGESYKTELFDNILNFQNMMLIGQHVGNFDGCSTNGAHHLAAVGVTTEEPCTVDDPDFMLAMKYRYMRQAGVLPAGVLSGTADNAEVLDWYNDASGWENLKVSYTQPDFWYTIVWRNQNDFDNHVQNR